MGVLNFYKADGSQGSKYLSSDLTYCPAGTAFRSSATAATGAESAECVDVLGRTTRTMTRGFDGLWDAVDTEYDVRGNVQRKSAPFDLTSGGQMAPYWTVMSYDLLGRVTSAQLPDNSSSTTTYSATPNGTQTVVVNDQNQSRTEVKNVLGEITDVYDNAGGHTQFGYDAQGNMTSMTDAASNQTVIGFDLLGRKTSMTDPDKGSWSYGYNKFGELTTQTDAKGQTQTMNYDGLGRMKTRVDRRADNSIEGSTTWTFDTAPYGMGQLANVLDVMSGYLKVVSYDSLGRADNVATTIGNTYTEGTTFDQYGRTHQVFDAAGDGSFTDQGVVQYYNPYGFLELVGDAIEVGGVPRTIYRKIIQMNARGQVTIEHLSDGVISTQRVYNNTTGRIGSITSTKTSNGDVQELSYVWDTLGNLSSRVEQSGSKNLSESFGYTDGMNRLTSYTVAGQAAVTVVYNSIGNITSKSDVGTYTYGAGTAGPHAVTNAGGVTYAYDGNGNNTSGDGRTIDYTTFDKPSSISKGGHTTQFVYGPDRARFKRTDSATSGTTVTRYLGNVEIIDRPDGTQEKKRYLAGIAIETIYFGSNAIEDYRETLYQFKDHLGSLDVLTDSAGSIVQEMSFDAWGQRRNAIDWQNLGMVALTTFDHSRTTRGYTGHEMLDEVGIIHMNGRIYDPKLGRFLQADPNIQEPTNTQSLNRYSYVLNNPLNATDPSGYFVFALAVAIAFADAGVSIGMIASFAFAGFADALVAGASFKDALLAGISSGAMTFAGGSLFPGGGGFGMNLPSARYVAQMGAIGGITNVLQGGKFGDGFKGAGIGTLTGGIAGNISNRFDLKKLGQGIVASIAAGTTSALTGGKFVSAAAYSAFSAALQSSGLLQGGGDEAQNSKTDALHQAHVDYESRNVPLEQRLLFANPADEEVLRAALSKAQSEAYKRRYPLGQRKGGSNATIGTVAKGTFGGGLSLGETSEDIPRNREQKPGGFAHNIGAIENAGAIAISLPPESAWRRNTILRRLPDWRFLSRSHGNIPVIVTSPYDKAVVLIQGNSNPVDLVWN